MATTPKEQAGSYAIIRTGGKQYHVCCGEKIWVEKLEAEPGATLTISEVLLLKAGPETEVKIGSPLVSGASVKTKVLLTDRDRKIIVFKKRRRKGYTKKQGHRQYRTRLLVESING